MMHNDDLMYDNKVFRIRTELELQAISKPAPIQVVLGG